MKAAAAVALIAGLSACAFAQDWTQWGGSQGRNMATPASPLPRAFEPGSQRTNPPQPPSKNVAWVARLGSETYGNPTVADGRVFVGTNNASPRSDRHEGDRGILLCLRESDGQLLWQLVVPKIPSAGQFNGDYPSLGICSSPTVDGDRVYVVTNRCEVLCLDVAGLANGNDGEFQEEAAFQTPPKAHRIVEEGDRLAIERGAADAPIALEPTGPDILWSFDMIEQVGSWPQDGSSCSVLIHGDWLYVGTSNGVDKSHKHIPSPQAPSLIVLDKNTGRLLAVDDAGIGPRIYHGQWSSPSLGVVDGRPLVFYGGGDGFCYAFDARPQPGPDGKPGVLKTVWKYDCNPPELKARDGKPIPYKTRGDGPSEIIATPVFHEGRVYVAVGQDPRHREGKGALSCIDASGRGDISRTGGIWTYRGIDRTLSTVSIVGDLLFAADYSGNVHCLDRRTGRPHWVHKTGQKGWASTFAGDGKVYLGTGSGYLWVFEAARSLNVMEKVRLQAPIYTTPISANGRLIVTDQKHLYAVEAGN